MIFILKSRRYYLSTYDGPDRCVWYVEVGCLRRNLTGGQLTAPRPRPGPRPRVCGPRPPVSGPGVGGARGGGAGVAGDGGGGHHGGGRQPGEHQRVRGHGRQVRLVRRAELGGDLQRYIDDCYN